MTNLPTYSRNEATITGRESEVALANFDDGANLAAACAPGVGICTAVVNPKLDDWTVADQANNARDPQNSQHIGGNGTATGSETVHPVRAADYAAVDINDTCHFLVADQAAAPGAVYHIASGAVNRSDENVEIGDRVWGTVPVA